LNIKVFILKYDVNRQPQSEYNSENTEIESLSLEDEPLGEDYISFMELMHQISVLGDQDTITVYIKPLDLESEGPVLHRKLILTLTNLNFN
jgi:hypothetical protein